MFENTKYVSTPYVPLARLNHLTPNKKYLVLDIKGIGAYIKDDNQNKIYVLTDEKCFFTDYKNKWTKNYK